VLRKIRFIQIGSADSTIIDNLATLLNKVQNAYNFYFDDDEIKIDDESVSENFEYTTKYLEKQIRTYMYNKKYFEYPIGITSLPIKDSVVSSSDDKIALISTYNWHNYSKYPLIKGLEYFVGSILLDIHITTEAHYDTKGCPNDFCDKQSDVDVGLSKSQFCESCKRMILSGLETGKITLQETIAINRILDDVADRKICFVLMPFKKEFLKSYDMIKQAVNDAGFTCIKDNEIFETRHIIFIIYELIGRAEVIVADLSNRNPNVFYELGYAHAMGKSTILITQNQDDVPFDLRHRQYILYSLDDVEALKKNIRSYFP